MYYVRVSSRVLLCRLFDRRSRTTSCFFYVSLFFSDIACVNIVYTRSIHLHSYLHTLCRFMQYRLIDTVSAVYPAQGPANYLLCFHSVDTLLLQPAKGGGRGGGGVDDDDINKLHFFSRDGTHTHTLIEDVATIRKVLMLFSYLFLSSSICYCCRLLIAVNCSAFACTSLTGKVLFLFLYIFFLYFFRASATYKLKTLCGQHTQTHLPGCQYMSPSTYKYVCM